MKKFFAFLMFAAALMTGCEDPKTSETGKEEEKEEQFYGMMLNEAEVVNRGDYYNDGTNSYIISMYKSEGSGEDKIYSRIVVAELITPEVNDGIIPAGKYTIADGTLAEGELTTHFAGSFYVRNTAEDGYIMLATEGYFEVKHLAEGGYQLTASFEGINAEDGSALAKTESRFEGQPAMMGLPASNNYEVYTPYGAQAQYESLGDGVAAWNIILGNTGAYTGEGEVIMDSFLIIGEDLGENVIPQGTFPIDRFGMIMPGTTYAANHVSAPSIEDEPVKDAAIAGYITIKAKGEGKYSIEAVTFGANGGYKQNYEGGVYIMTNKIALNIDVAQAIYAGIYDGVPYWALFLGDSSRNELIRLFVNVEATEDPYATGIPTGQYVVSDTMQPGTIDSAYQSSGGWGGSLIVDLSTQSQLVDLIFGGTMNVVNNGDGTYVIDVDFSETYYEVNYVGSYSGAIQTADESGGGGSGDAPQAIQIAVDELVLEFYGGGAWVAYLPGEKTDTCYMLALYNDEDATLADGLASGTYTVSDSSESMTIYPGFVDSDGAYGSLLLTYDMTGYYDIVSEGEMVVENKGSDNYALEGVITGERYEIHFTYDGAATVQDATATAVAPAKVAPKAPAPLKSNIAEPKVKGEQVRATPLFTVRGMEFAPATKLNF